MPNIPGIAGIAGALRRGTSVKTSDKGNGESGARDGIDAAAASLSAPETARNSGEIGAERTEKDKEREEKKRKRKSFMEVVSGMRGETNSAATPPTVDSELQGSSGDACAELLFQAVAHTPELAHAVVTGRAREVGRRNECAGAVRSLQPI